LWPLAPDGVYGAHDGKEGVGVLVTMDMEESGQLRSDANIVITSVIDRTVCLTLAGFHPSPHYRGLNPAELTALARRLAALHAAGATLLAWRSPKDESVIPQGTYELYPIKQDY
jgi:hypothetical protein